MDRKPVNCPACRRATPSITHRFGNVICDGELAELSIENENLRTFRDWFPFGLEKRINEKPYFESGAFQL